MPIFQLNRIEESMISEELTRCIEFIQEIEKLKIVYRQNSVLGNSRNENSAEHSWHIAIMAMILQGFSDDKSVDMLKIIKMLLIHDIVEIDVGDTFLYDAESNISKMDREIISAKRYSACCPIISATSCSGYGKSSRKWIQAEAKFARALDSLQPLMNHLPTKDEKYLRHNVKTSQVIEKKKHIGQASAALWTYAQEVIQKSEKAGLYTQ